MNFLKSCIITAFFAILVACGGGGDTPATANVVNVDKYVGTWVTNCDGFRERNYVTVTKASDTVLNYSVIYRQWSDVACTTGMSILPESATGTFTVSGTKSIGADTVDKFVQVVVGSGGVTSGTFNEVIKFSTTSYQLGLTGPGAVLDAQQFPTQLDPAEIYFKQ